MFWDELGLVVLVPPLVLWMRHDCNQKGYIFPSVHSGNQWSVHACGSQNTGWSQLNRMWKIWIPGKLHTEIALLSLQCWSACSIRNFVNSKENHSYQFRINRDQLVDCLIWFAFSLIESFCFKCPDVIINCMKNVFRKVARFWLKLAVPISAQLCMVPDRHQPCSWKSAYIFHCGLLCWIYCLSDHLLCPTDVPKGWNSNENQAPNVCLSNEGMF